MSDVHPDGNNSEPLTAMIKTLRVARLAFAGAAVTVLAIDFFFPGTSASVSALGGTAAGVAVVALKVAHVIV